MTRVHIIHENPKWIEPVRAVLSAREVAFEDVFMDQGTLDPSSPVPAGIFFNKMSSSSYTRGHRYSPEYTLALLSHLEAQGRRVINGSNALRLETSKIEQYVQLKKAGIRIPDTVAAFGKQSILEAAKLIEGPFVLKPNRGGKGIGVQHFQSRRMLEEYLNLGTPDFSCDDIMIVQKYIEPANAVITRLEFIASKFVYAVAVDTSQGFELCPAEACRIDAPAAHGETCAINADNGLFRIIPTFQDPIVQELETFLKAHNVDVAGIEFIRDRSGNTFVYDMNMNTNYNPEAEKKAGVSAMEILADFLAMELKRAGTL